MFGTSPLLIDWISCCPLAASEDEYHVRVETPGLLSDPAEKLGIVHLGPEDVQNVTGSSCREINTVTQTL